MSGYVKAQRDRFAHPIFASEKFCRGYAWDWIVAQAAWRDVPVEINGQIVTLKRGQLCHSVRFMATAWGWSKSSVGRFLTRLETETMIGTDTGTGQLIITVCNYDKYQADNDAGGTAKGTARGTGAGQERDKNEGREEGKKRITEVILCALTDAGVSEDVASEFMEHRKAIRAKLTERSAKMIANKIREHPNADAVLCESIANGWRGVFPESVKQQRSQSSGSETAKRAAAKWRASRGMDSGPGEGSVVPLLHAADRRRD